MRAQSGPYDSLPRIYLKLGHFPVKIGLIRGVGGSPTLFFDWNLPFILLGSSCKNSELYDKSSRIYLKSADFRVKIGLNGGQGGPQIFF